MPSAAGTTNSPPMIAEARLDVLGVVRDLLEAVGPIMAPACEDFDRLVGEVDLDAVAVEFDFMDPTGAGWHLLDRGRHGRFYEGGGRAP